MGKVTEIKRLVPCFGICEERFSGLPPKATLRKRIGDAPLDRIISDDGHSLECGVVSNAMVWS